MKFFFTVVLCVPIWLYGKQDLHKPKASAIDQELQRLADEYDYVFSMCFYRLEEFRPLFDSAVPKNIFQRGDGFSEFYFTQSMTVSEKDSLRKKAGWYLNSKPKPEGSKKINEIESWCIAFRQFECMRRLYNNDSETLLYMYLASKKLKKKLLELGLIIRKDGPESLASAMIYFYHFEMLKYISTLEKKEQRVIYAEIYKSFVSDK